MPRLHLAALLAAGTLVLACTACSGTPGTPAPAAAGTTSSAAESTPPAAPALDAAKVGTAVADAAKQASAVHVKGTMVQEGSTVNVDLQLNPDSANGTVVKDGLEIPVLRVGDKYYFRFTSSLVKQAGVPASAAKQLTGKWVSSTAKIGAGLGEAFKTFLDYGAFTNGTIGELGKSTFTLGEPTTLAGTPALSFKSVDGTATVAAAEPHYLLRMSDPKDGAMEFSDWNKPTTINAPAASELYTGPGA
ncbi:hypothetical protein DMA12_04675 [Amycolatopsis balhimycina DSM 5908]|uniref:LppX_LprAFG lipoprotein n=1 Tax=Amycolatopsis balhimycina DSM 5908 TaxID=1081091 RepID=A0A428X125_AMYBA|nr:hypothetical protein [Amycolatopsis balhimycina]RSM49018.1 hypothetical protein DMA12_04675 [Amycolatopsis balhimycina DSM 5908]